MTRGCPHCGKKKGCWCGRDDTLDALLYAVLDGEEGAEGVLADWHEENGEARRADWIRGTGKLTAQDFWAWYGAALWMLPGTPGASVEWTGRGEREVHVETGRDALVLWVKRGMVRGIDTTKMWWQEHGPGLTRCCPLERVHLRGMNPGLLRLEGKEWNCWTRQPLVLSSTPPASIFDVLWNMGKGRNVTQEETSLGPLVIFRRATEARDALNEAALAWARGADDE